MPFGGKFELALSPDRFFDLKSGAHTDVERRIEEVRGELSERIAALAGLIEARLPGQRTAREAPDHAMVHRETTVTQRG